jgi:uncharacterized protein YodC (DUF2158 family)
VVVSPEQGRIANMEIGTKVRQKSGEGPLMTIKRVTPQGYPVCYWHDQHGTYRERMFLPEMVVREESSEPKGADGDGPKAP